MKDVVVVAQESRQINYYFSVLGDGILHGWSSSEATSAHCLSNFKTVTATVTRSVGVQLQTELNELGTLHASQST